MTKAAELVSDDKTTEERVLLLVDIKEMAERTGQLESEIRELYDIRARSQVELEHYQIVVADMGY